MLRLQLLGGFRAFVADDELSALAKQPRRAALLAYLALERDVARTAVIALLWPDVDPDRARHSLNQAIYYLRRIIGADWVELRGDRCVIAPWVSTDVDELERATAAAAHEDVLRLYQGPLLAGTTLATTVAFEMWIDRRRAAIERLHRRARRQHVADLIAAGRTAEALHCAEEWCRLDPLEDEAQHRYMQLLASVGQRSAALRQYAVYQRLLDEYDLKPLDETTALVERLQHGEAALLPNEAIASVAPPQKEPLTPPAAVAQPASAPPLTPVAHAPAVRQPRSTPWLLQTTHGLSMLFVAVFLFNWIETSIEVWLVPKVPAITALRLQLARASHWFEGYLSFDYHELTNRFAVIGYSTAYFLVFPALLVAVGVTLARRSSIRPYRVFALGVTINYLINLPFFLLFPVPERWFYAESGAMVLSDLWSERFIQMFRPISGLDNSFPSFHVSLTVLLVLLGFVYVMRFRWSMLFLGGIIVLATLALGIHWVTDIAAGAAVGVLSLVLARRFDGRLPDVASLPARPTAPPLSRPAITVSPELVAR